MPASPPRGVSAHRPVLDGPVATARAERLAASYERCRGLSRAHGTTYHVATYLLPAASRPAVYALYGFARHADEIVDDLAASRPLADRAAALDALGEELRRGVAGGASDHPVLAALVDAIHRHAIPFAPFEDFLRSMAMDLEVRDYATHDDLMEYMRGSAAAIGLMMAPVLGYRDEAALPAAADLGVAFQLTNFLRDVEEDLARGRVYIPAETLERHGIGRADLERYRAAGVADGRFVAAMGEEIARTRRLYARATLGIPLLEPASQPCIRVAMRLYRRILDRIEARGCQVFGHRARVRTTAKIAYAAPRLAQARWRQLAAR